MPTVHYSYWRLWLCAPLTPCTCYKTQSYHLKKNDEGRVWVGRVCVICLLSYIYILFLYETSSVNYKVRVSEADISKAIDQLKENSASGPDGIPAIFLKTKMTIAKPLMLLMSQSLSLASVLVSSSLSQPSPLCFLYFPKRWDFVCVPEKGVVKISECHARIRILRNWSVAIIPYLTWQLICHGERFSSIGRFDDANARQNCWTIKLYKIAEKKNHVYFSIGMDVCKCLCKYLCLFCRSRNRRKLQCISIDDDPVLTFLLISGRGGSFSPLYLLYTLQSIVD